ncbi:MAG: ABC transporter permease [Clostridiaceae bacterium]|nr:ABC transporter permease [Clostridiaceae bacterium]
MNDLLLSILVHLQITFTGVLIAAVTGIIAGIVITKNKTVAAIVMSLTDIVQTIPSVALLAILMMLFGLGDTTAVVALALYSLLPIVRNTYAGITGVDKGLIEAGRGMGMTKIQLLVKVQLPMALPVILSGLRMAIITALGIATIGVLIGAGGLGYFIYRGVQISDLTMILKGAVPVSLLAVFVDLILQYSEKKMAKKAKRA